MLKPHEILQKLGFDVKEEGLSINPKDAYLYTIILELIGKAMKFDFDSLTDEEIIDKFSGVSAFIDDDNGRETYLKNLNQSTQYARVTIESIFQTIRKN